MEKQTFKDFDVVISDHSKDYKLQELCEEWKDKLNIKYLRNEECRGSPAQNTNNSIKNAKGRYIKILNQDDFLIGEDALQIISDNLIGNVNFLATGYLHTRDRIEYYNYHKPQLNNMISVVNTIGTPSCIAVRNFNNLPKMDEELFYAYDCEWYHSYMQRYGEIKLIPNITIGTFIWNESITSGITQDFIDKENNYILKKHGYIQ
jgi:glycosyltransferase involved in cell wall biosynthesis